MSGARDADLAARLILLRLSKVGPARLRWLTSQVSPSEAVVALRAGRLPEGCDRRPRQLSESDVRVWFDEVRAADASAEVELHIDAGIEILHPNDPDWPFVDDPDPPALLFTRGNRALLGRQPAVGMVGTRRCTSLGRSMADRISRGLVEADVAIISGLALGIDGAAHRACLDAGGVAVGVVAGGLDVVYPPRHADLWAQMASEGLIVSEWPLGSETSPWKFPARNRIIAALSDLVVVVESHAHGGALSTADEAALRGVTVGAMPGSPISEASWGTNALLFDGCPLIRHAADVLELLGVDVPATVREAAEPPKRAPRKGRSVSKRPPRRRNGEAAPTIFATQSDRRLVRPPPLAGLGLGDLPLGERIVTEVAAGDLHIDRLVLAVGDELASVLSCLHELSVRRIVRFESGIVSLEAR